MEDSPARNPIFDTLNSKRQGGPALRYRPGVDLLIVGFSGYMITVGKLWVAGYDRVGTTLTAKVRVVNTQRWPGHRNPPAKKAREWE